MLRSVPLALLATLVLVPAAWAGTTYYAAPLTANTTTCDQANPCTLVAAVGKATDGDTVQLAPGDYHRGGGAGGPLLIGAGLTIEGQPGAARPRIVQEDPYTACDCGILHSAGHVTFRHLFLDQSVDGAGSGGFVLNDGDVVDDVLSVGGNFGGFSTTPATIRDSVLLGVVGGLQVQGATHLEHVTAVGTGAAGVGLMVVRNGNGTAAVTVNNSIVQGGSSGHDVTATTFDPDAAIIVTARYSALARSSGDSGGTGTEQFDLTDHVLAADPIFNGGGYGVTGASPTVDAGSAALTTGLVDFSGLPRILGSAPDMGAFEYAPAPEVQAAAGDVTQTTAALTGSATTAIPADAHFEYGTDANYGTTVGAVSLPGATAPATVGAALQDLAPGTTYHFRLVATNEHGTTATPDATFTTAAATVAPPPTTTPVDTTPPHITKVSVRWPRIRFVLDEPARVTFTIGKRHWTRNLRAGAATIKVPLRVRRAVKHGKHSLRIVAVDATGNRGVSLRKRFSVR
jgi:hypothetical protein